MTDNYRNYSEFETIALSAYYSGSKGDKEKATHVLNKISEKTNCAYLNERAEDQKVHSLDSEKMISALTSLFDDLCANDLCNICSLNKYCNKYINSRVNNYDPDAPVMIDLFCGSGGLSLGFTREGFIISLANDIEPCCIDTYSHNHPEVPRENVVLGDINEILNQPKKYLRFEKADVIVGGPPCQGFSMANRQRIIDDPRNKLYKSYVKFVSIIKPKFFVMENVKGMLSVANQVVEDFKNIGYSVSYKVLNAKDFGVPQNRERLIYIGNRIGVDNDEVFERIVSLGNQIPDYYLKDALFGLRPLKASRKMNSTEKGDNDSGFVIEKNTSTASNDYISLINGTKKQYPLVFNHKARYNNDRDIEIFGRLFQGDKSDDPKIADIMPYKSRSEIFKDKYYKLEENNVSKTITAHMKFDCNMYIHPTQARGLTPREAARIQSYPDNYFFRGPYTKTYMQIGNSVPPLLSRAIALTIKQYI